ncbi:FRAS1-related extracellular matrix protein 3 [Trichosurus vulpecula]|uniref:FRAS1-related extracellular matrix protein 3 n=1 Tax=Trichosurus vulpecula TaxID=9337 RepID=UPI00186B5431|nr:FRAS1-related extracellular matrix protein 3 [Trichosurus vulpecula]
MTGARHRPPGTSHQLLTVLAVLVLCCPTLRAQTPEPELSVPGLIFAAGSHSPEGAGILAPRPGLRVPLGRSMLLDPARDLVIRVQPGDRCMVTVLGKEGGRVATGFPPPGALSPVSFPCAFGPEQVRYTHFGARSPAHQRLRLQLRYDSPSRTFILPFTMPVDVDFTQFEVVTHNLPLTVEKLRGFSNAIDHRVLNFSTASLTASSPNGVPLTCRLTPLPRESGPLPRYGKLVDHSGDPLPPGTEMDCQVFLMAGVHYQHTASTRSPNRDYVPFLVEILGPEKEGDIRLPRILAQEHFQMLVRIQEGTENTPPRPSFGAMMMMEVDQFVLTALTQESLAAEDLESNSDDLVFNILSSPTALPESHRQQGYLINTDDPFGQPVTSFTQRDLRELKIAYQPPTDDSNQERLFQLELEVTDVDGAASDPFAFMVVVKPMNTLAPVASRNQGLLLFEGQSRPLSSAQSLEISDEDNLEEVRVTVAKGLRHGQLVVLGAPTERKYFTSADLTAERVIYQHDGSDTYSDNIIFHMGDGLHDVEFLFSITIVPGDDEPPIVNTNTGLSLAEGEVVQISRFVLSATDIDSEDSTIRFVLKKPALEGKVGERGWGLAPSSSITMQHLGEVLLRQSEPPPPLINEGGQGWAYVEKEGLYEKVVTEWLQQDILEGRLFYHHLGAHHPRPMIDQLVFHVQDDHDPPNQSGQHFFIIKVQPVDILSPELHPGVSLEMTVKEYQLTPFQKKFLCYTDVDSDDWHLRYMLLTPPTDIDNNHPVPAGEIVLTDDPTTPVTQFTQAQVNHHKVAYQPPQQEVGIAPRVVQFMYRVEDASGNSVPGTFSLFLQPVDNQPPEITNSGFTVREGKNFILTTRELDVIDPDTDADKIVFTLAQGPQHGHLLYLERVMASGTYFMKDDIFNGHISYQHSGSETTNDAFQLIVSDMVHQVPITIQITIKTIDDEITIPGGGWVGISIDVVENGATEITTGIIQGTDMNTDNLMTFTVEKSPKLGIILVNGLPTEQFTQSDLINGAVVYAHTGGEIGMQTQHDAFNLTISDHSDVWVVEGKIVEGVQVQVTVLPIDSVPPEVKVGELFSVPEGGKGTLTLRHLDTKDVDTPHDDVLCTITGQPSFGYLENSSPAPGSEKSQVGTPISAFTINDVRLGHINYIQSIHKGVEPRKDQVTFYCSDGVNFSPNYIFPIIILPTNDEQPELFTREFVVLEGMSLVIDTPLLNSADADLPPDELQFQITVQPQNGRIVQQLATGSQPVHSFTLEEIQEASTIVYEHDDSETKEDSFEVWVTDGKHMIHRKIPITVILVDDETPRLTINDGLEVDIGQTKVITNQVLQATDLDSDDKDLAYILRSGPGQGLLQKLLEPGGKVWSNLTLGMNFTQSEIDQGLICYSHKVLEGAQDLIKFDVTDGINPLLDKYFYVTISGTDKVFPEVINKGVTLKEGGRVTLTTDLLSTSDINSPDEQLCFSITRAPSRGHLESSDFPGKPIDYFTQLQLAGNKISYVHTAEDEVKMDSFEFEVTDGHNTIFQTFHVSIIDVDNKKPVLTIHHLLVQEGERKLITPFELSAEDQDSSDSHLRFTITHIPTHGQILYNGSQPISSFTKQDLNENLISYWHDGTETTEDSFSFIVTDGTHTDFYIFPDTVLATHKPQVMKIRINSLDNGVPQIVVNKGAPALRILQTGHLGFLITSKSLKAKDQDSPHKLLKYTVTSGPEHGNLIHLGLGSGNIKMFIQADIDEMKLCYVLKEGSNATSDTFYFSVEDTGGNKLTSQSFHLNWAWISLEKERYVIDEESKLLEVTLKRRGYLGETSFISIGTKNGTAQKDKDFKGKPQKQVQFNPGQSTATWKVRIISDGKYETSETFHIILSDPVMAALEFPKMATVEIVDPNDESTVYIPESEYRIEEDIGELLIPIRRSGDVSQELMVLCSTHQGTASGTIPSSVLSYSDYISRPEDHTSILRFDKDETEKRCRVIIIDDSLYEKEETFNITLSMPMGGQVGVRYPSSKVVILKDADDEPALYFENAEYHVDESAGFVEVFVWRKGTDLSKPATVTIQSRKTEPVSAEAGMDYIGVSQNLNFAAGEDMKTFHVTILDDLGQPVLEGLEKFELVLCMPMDSVLGEPSKTTIIINDTVTDLPKVQFKKPFYTGNERDGQVKAIISRNGDISHNSTVRCYTRQGSAQVTVDYKERPNTDDSIVIFLPGETEKACVVTLEDDFIYEDDEEFRLILGTPKSSSAFGASVGEQKEMLIRVKDEEDKPVIKFSKGKYSVQEPQHPGDSAVLRIPVVRLGDTSKVSVVRTHTKDGSAASGEDYNPVSKDIEFKEGETEHFIEIEVLYDGIREMREALTVHLKPDENMVAEIQMNKAVVYIEEVDSVADVTFPAIPQVVSLLMYGDASATKEKPSPPPGYPVVCVTACNSKYPDYGKTGSICTVENINDTLTLYRWLVGAPASSTGVTSPMQEIDANTFFTNTKSITLDSIYFQAGSRVQCAARAVSKSGDVGLELLSSVITVSKDGLCQPRMPGMVGAEPFSARIRYTGPDEPDYPNLIKLTVRMPHLDGMLPVISTQPLSNFELTLSPDGMRVGNHKCSNLLDYSEIQTRHGFITKYARSTDIIGETLPYQYNASLRPARTLRFYHNLNLDACLWEFNSYYAMSELLTACGGSVSTDGQVLNIVQSYVTLRVPLFVSYVFHSSAAVGDWKHFDLRSELRLTFVYDTAILWKEGIGNPPGSELQGTLHPTSMRINEEGRLVVNFQTEIWFRGQFVISHPGMSLTSVVVSTDHPGLTFTLSLLRSEPASHQPRQQWSFVSDFAIWDYSGTYTIKLIPCVAAPQQEYTLPIICHPREPITFDLDIRFQQVSDPVDAEFSLNTRMFLLSKKELWVSDDSMDFLEGSDVAFSEGSIIYGRVTVDPVQNLGDTFTCNIEKVFLCTGVDGYVPKYNPENKDYGCLVDSPSLLYRFKILDRAQPETQVRRFRNVSFNAHLAADHEDALPLVKQPGSDGFSLSSAALFQVAAGREWYLHAIYTVRSRENANKDIGKRSIEYQHMPPPAVSLAGALSSKRSRRANSDASTLTQDISADQNRGTNIQHVSLVHSTKAVFSHKGFLPPGTHDRQPGLEMADVKRPSSTGPVIGGTVSLLLLSCTMLVFLLRHRRWASDKKAMPGNRKTITVQHGSNDSSEV